MTRRSAAIRWRQLQWISSGASTRFDAFPYGAVLQGASYVSMSDPSRLTWLDEPCPMDQPTSDVPWSPASTAPRLQSAKSAHRPCRYRSCGFHLQVRTASRTPGEERALRTIQNAFRRERPSYVFTYEEDSSGYPVKETSKNHAHRFALRSYRRVRSTRATISLGLGTRVLTRLPRCVRPTSAIHSLPETCTRALGFRPAWSRAG